MNWSGLTLTPAPADVSFAAFELTPPPASLVRANPRARTQQRDFQEFTSPVPVIIENQFFGNDFPWWPRAPAPINRAKDWIAFPGNVIVGVPPFFTFMPFDPALRPRNFAKDWTAFSGSISVESFPAHFDFLSFALGRHAKNFAKDWIAYSGNEQVEDFPRIGIDFLAFAPGRTAKLFGLQHAPQWWPGYFKAQFFPNRDRHDGDWIPRRRHPPVYEQSYYDTLRERTPHERRKRPRPKTPNLLIPISGIIPARQLPTLMQLPPPWPMPTLTIAPPPFRMATQSEMDADDDFIIRMLLED
jgi:hypothetical protein